MAVLFFKKAVPATSSGNAELAGYAGETVYYEAQGVCASAAGGVLDGRFHGGGVVTLNDATQRAAVQLSGLGYAAGDRMTVGWQSSGLAPTTADVVAVVS